MVIVTYLLRMADVISGSSFEPKNPDRTETEVCLKDLESENDLEKKIQTLKS